MNSRENLVILIGSHYDDYRLKNINTFDHENPPFINKLFKNNYYKVLIDYIYEKDEINNNIEIISGLYEDNIDYLIALINNTEKFVIIHSYTGEDNKSIINKFYSPNNKYKIKKDKDLILFDYTLFKSGFCYIEEIDYNNIPTIKNNKFIKCCFNDYSKPTIKEYLYLNSMNFNNKELYLKHFILKLYYSQFKINEKLDDDKIKFIKITLNLDSEKYYTDKFRNNIFIKYNKLYK